ncbi:hypothetical protein A9Q74_03810 [Colwellia sp. 39_35_sub15_T18]|nr:hypothetical protein A9Q74_03810 [Colwellia sp. 39_35_sub15_T18]
MKNSNIHRWLGAVIALLVFIMPVLLADELSLLANWLFTFTCWLIVIAMGLIKVTPSPHSNTKQKGQ